MAYVPKRFIKDTLLSATAIPAKLHSRRELKKSFTFPSFPLPHYETLCTKTCPLSPHLFTCNADICCTPPWLCRRSLQLQYSMPDSDVWRAAERMVGKLLNDKTGWKGVLEEKLANLCLLAVSRLSRRWSPRPLNCKLIDRYLCFDRINNKTKMQWE